LAAHPGGFQIFLPTISWRAVEKIMMLNLLNESISTAVTWILDRPNTTERHGLGFLERIEQNCHFSEFLAFTILRWGDLESPW
jgi:hypothetical protein